MVAPNPYAAPVDAPPMLTHTDNAWREGMEVVLPRHGAILPDRCVKCNAPAHGHRLSKTFYWHNPALYIVVLFSPLIYVLLALIVRKSAQLQLPLCPEHRSKRRNGLIIGWVGALGSFALLFAGIAIEVPAIIVLSLLTLIVAPIVGIIMSRVAQVKKIDDFQVRLSCGNAFTESIPWGHARPPGLPPYGGYGGYGGGYGYGPPGGYALPPGAKGGLGSYQ